MKVTLRQGSAAALLLLALLAGWLVRPAGQEDKAQAPAATSQASSPRLNRGPMPKAVADFETWARDYLADEKARQLEEGLAMAEAHRAAMKELIMTDPERALASAVPMAVRQKLPAEIVERLERRILGRGSYEVQAVSPDSDPSEPRVRRFATIGGQELRAHVYGARADQLSTPDTLMWGIAVDRELALSENRLRSLEVGELPDPAKKQSYVCPVSQKTQPMPPAPQPVNEETPAVETETEIIFLCDGGHIRVLEEEIRAGEGATGSPTAPNGTLPITRNTSTGVRKFIYMRVVFPDRLQEPQTEKEAWANVKTLTDYFQENSYGRCSFVGTVTPILVLPRTEAWYIQDYNTTGSNSPIMADSREAARALGYPADDYQHFVCIYSGGPGSFGGLGSVGGGNTWLKTTAAGTFQHEFGHNVGVWHSNFWSTSGASITGPGSNVEYGHTLDVMGASSSGGHFNASMKEQLSWLGSEVYHTALSSGTYRLFQTDQVNQDAGRFYALRVAKDADRDYWVEFRQRHSGNPWYHNGATINWSPWGHGSGADSSTVRGSNRGTQLLDMTPGSPDDRNDSPLVIGRTFSDTGSGVHITPVGKAGTTPESLDVVVNLGTHAGNQPPVISSLSADNLTPAVNGSVSLSVTATDADGDPLAYFWSFGDKLASYNGHSFSTNNAASQNKSWSAAGYYNVQCTVSDMKGGSVTQSLLITVGTPSTYYIEGTVKDESALPLPGIRVSNGATGSSWRGGVTDSSGLYRITNLTAGTITLTLLEAGYSFTPNFTHPVSLSGNITGADWTAAESLPRVTLEAVDGETTEDNAADTALLRLTRTGSTGGTLTVTLDFQGSTTASDYTLSPPADTSTASPLELFTIPAGSSTLDITLTASSDSNSEGPEMVSAALVNGPGYVPAGSQLAAVTIVDQDSTNPRVSVVATDLVSTENNAADTARFTFTRQGSTSSAVTVYFALGTGSGAATNGSDYGSIASSVTIPSGSSSAELEIIPLDDTAAEGVETLSLSLNSGIGYVTGSPSLAAIKILDDDINTVSVTATDGTANENGDPGTFTFTRTGDSTLPLLVHYSVSGTAAHGVDYQALDGIVRFAPGATSVAVDILPFNDQLGEPSQDVVVQLRSSQAYLLGTSNRATVNLLDDNDPPLVAINLTDGGIAEGGTADTGTFRITTSGTGSGNITVNYTVSGTATAGADYTSLSGSLSIGRNTTANITLTPVNDVLLEDAETVIVTLSPSAAYTVDLQDSVTAVIRDDDRPMVNLSVLSASMSESSSGGFYLSRTGATTSGLTVNYSLAGTASAGDDYSALSGSATIPAGSSGVQITVSPVNDSASEGLETLVMNLLPDSAYGIQVGSATLLMTDNDSSFTSTLGFASASTTAEEASGTGTILVNRGGSTAGASRVEYGVISATAQGSGVDFSLANGVLDFPPGSTQQAISFQVRDDEIPETPEAFVVQLRNATGASLVSNSTQHSLLILDNEPRVNIEIVDPFMHEDSADTAAFRVVRSGSTATALVVPLLFNGTAANGSDVATVPASVTIPAGSASATQVVTAATDALSEGSETFEVSLGGSANFLPGPRSSVSLMIGDAAMDDPPWVTILSPRGSMPGVPAGAVLELVGAVSDDGSVTSLWSQVAGPGTTTFENATAAVTRATFSASGTYTLRLQADDGSSVSQAEVTLAVGAAVIPWTSTNISNPTLPGTAVSQHGVHLLVGGGNSLSGSSDNFLLQHRPMNGDGSVTARVRSTTLSSTSARIGVAMRESTAAGSRHAVMGMAPTSGNLSALHYRLSTGGSAATATSSGLSPGYWVRLVRSGNLISAFDSPDGIDWTQRGSTQTISMGSTILSGLAVMSASTTRLNLALIDNVTITGTTENVGAAVNAGSDTTTVLPASFALPLAGSIQDDALTFMTTGTWSQVSGPGTTVFSGAFHQTTATVSTPGTYTYRLTADDGDVRTLDEVTVTATSPISEWRTFQFGAQAGNPAIAGDSADPDQDGLTNLVEYALGLEAHDPGRNKLPDVETSSGQCHLIYTRRTSALDVTTQVEWSTHLATWSTAGVTEQVLATNDGIETVKASVTPPPGEPKCFMRVRVTRP